MHQQQNWLRKVDEKGDFIANMRYDPQSETFILIHQQNRIDIACGVGNLAKIRITTLHFESNVYDSLVIGSGFIVSNRNMPVRLYSRPSEPSAALSWISFNDKKPNSEQFLFPLQFASHSSVVVGGGKKFLSQYDCNKLAVRKVKSMGKKFISAVELLDDSVVAAGQFDGALTFLDLRSEEAVQSLKPHVDLVTRIKRVPQREHHVVSLARKDNYSYLWDCRKLETFLNCYEEPLYANQRTGLDISNDGTMLFLGGESGNITGRSLESGEITFRHFTSVPRGVSSVCVVEGGVVFAVGEREFPFQESASRSGYVGFVSTK